MRGSYQFIYLYKSQQRTKFSSQNSGLRISVRRLLNELSLFSITYNNMEIKIGKTRGFSSVLIVSGLTAKWTNKLPQVYCSTGSVLHRRKPFSALSQFWLVEFRAGNDLPRGIAFADGRRL